MPVLVEIVAASLGPNRKRQFELLMATNAFGALKVSEAFRQLVLVTVKNCRFQV